MDRTDQGSLITTTVTALGEPQHLHLDRATRIWLAHAEDGRLLPYADVSGTPLGDPAGAGKVAE